jgi:lipoyl(octanoyl) transferase
MDLEPFLRINPCGYAGLEMVQTCDINGPENIQDACKTLVKHSTTLLEASVVTYQNGLPAINKTA